MRAARIFPFARTSRWAMVAGATRKARAISSTESPHSVLSVSATWASRASAGWQQVKIEAHEVVRERLVRELRRRRGLLGEVRDLAPLRAARPFSRRRWSIALCRAVETSHARGFRGTPSARPLLERGGEGLLQRVLGEVEVAQQPDEGGEGARALLAVEGLEVHGAARQSNPPGGADQRRMEPVTPGAAWA